MRLHHVRHVVLVAMSSCDFFIAEHVDPRTTALADIEFFAGDDDGTSLSFDGSWDDVLAWFTTHLDPGNTGLDKHIGHDTADPGDLVDAVVTQWMSHLESSLLPGKTRGKAAIIELDGGKPIHVTATTAKAPPVSSANQANRMRSASYAPARNA